MARSKVQEVRYDVVSETDLETSGFQWGRRGIDRGRGAKPDERFNQGVRGPGVCMTPRMEVLVITFLEVM